MAKNLNKWLDEFVKNGADANNVVDWPENAGGGSSIPAVETLPETGKEGDLVILKKIDGKTVVADEVFYYIKNGDPTNIENNVKKQLNISEDTRCSINSKVISLETAEEFTIKINSAEDLIGHNVNELYNAYLSIENLKIENYLFKSGIPPIGDSYNIISVSPIGFEGILNKSTISGDKLTVYSRTYETDENDIITGFDEWELDEEYTIIRLENKDEFIDFTDPANQHIIDENDELYGKDQWMYLGEFSKPIYAESTYELYTYNDGKWNPVNSDVKVYSPACYMYGAFSRAALMFNNPLANYEISTDALIDFLTDDIMGSIPFEPNEEGSDQYIIKYFYNNESSTHISLSRRSSSDSASLYIQIGSSSSDDKITITISDLINETGDTISSFLNRNKQAIREAIHIGPWEGITLGTLLMDHSGSLDNNFCTIAIPNSPFGYTQMSNVVKFLNIFVRAN